MPSTFFNLGEYESNLNHIKEACAKLWKRPQHHHYTGHGIRHSETIIERLTQLLEGGDLRFKPVETFILLAGAYLHDIGMQCVQRDLLEEVAGIDKKSLFPFGYKELEEIRKRHAELSCQMILTTNSNKDNELPDLGLSRVDYLIVDAIARVSRAHSDSNYKDYCPEEDTSVPGIPRLQLLAVLLRLGDALDATRERCEWGNFQRIAGSLPVESQANFWKHFWVSNVIIENGRIRLVFPIPAIYDSAKSGIQAMAEEHIRLHENDLQTILWRYVRIGVDDPKFPPNSPKPPESMPDDVIDYFIDYGSARGGQKEELRIPEEYRRWLSEQCEKMDISRLMSPGRPITINLPEVFILLYASPPVKKQPLNPRSIEMGHEPVDIEELAAGNRYLVVEGQAGSGKTTLLKHLAYCIMEKQGYKGLGKYLPVLVFLKDMPNIETKKKITASSATAERYLSQYFDETANGLDIATVKRFCEADKAIFLIDGLDEIDPEMRMTLVDSLACFRSRYNTCKMVLCSRPHGVDGTVMGHFGKNRVVILSLNETQVKGFIKVWFEHIYNRSTIGEKTSEGMISDIKSHQNIKELLETPLMLTAICILYYDERELPGQRADLYRKFIDHLLYKRFGSEKERVHNYLMELAFKQHEKEARRFNKVFALETMGTIYPQGESETGDEYRRRLEKRFDEIEQNCGLLKLKGGQYEFWHLTFQEFLTATYIVAKRYNYSEAIQGYWDNKWYHEVIELFIGLLSIQNSGWANKIVSDELSKEDQPPFIRWRLASRSLLGIHRDSREPRVLEHARECLLSLFDSGGDPKILVDAGEILGWVGDPRDLRGFIPIGGGDYNLRSVGRGIPIKPFEIGKYPVTNGWFEEFIRAGGYKNMDYWSEEGKRWLEEKKVEQPSYWNERKWRCPNAPVVWVLWYEAYAFTRWLTHTMDDGYEYRLPDEYEWEAASAGREGRIYPWGDKWDKERCNNGEIKIGRTSPVGVFKKGDTPDGISDMAGNVWEWTDSWYSKEGGARVLRGGSWLINSHFCRCACRNYIYPFLRINYAGFRCARDS